MSRKLSMAAEFEQGTLIEVTTTGDYHFSGKEHAYYVPEKARLDAGMQRVRETETTEQHRDGEVGYNWDSIRDTVTAMEIVERAEQEVMNRSDGDIGDVRRRGIQWQSRGADDDVTIPAGVVKFADPKAGDESGTTRDPIERGLLWGTLKDSVLVDTSDIELQYSNDIGSIRRANVPVAVLTEGTEMIIAYLAAHDHRDWSIAHAFGLDTQDVQEILAQLKQ